ncbi:TolC family protein [Mucilaginibacter terrigena]|uniref:TolC family protein n=1 Tax=Mucilaginibacter terrigena TaxID=2492395 RepID=A0A4Q5LQW9_9SPHI|nr:TolC family protein [Mucilaginibacter terrigena]RYU91908.1 TolC family protein [Mucilaginibacter terrigena]
MKHLLLIIGICGAIFTANAQTTKLLRLEDCYVQARANYPLVNRQQLISKSAQYSIENAAKGYLPQISINGQATYQSDVTQVPIKLSGVDVPTISKDQYKAFASINQTIYDGGAIKLKKQMIQAEADLNSQQLEVDLYQLKERINQLFFGVLIANQQLAQTDTVKRDIQLGLSKVNAAIVNGTALKSNADVLQAELLKLEQRGIELKATRSAFMQMLGLFINQPLADDYVLEMPAQIIANSAISRPELKLFDAQKTLIDYQAKNVTSKNLPKLGLFLEGGYGRPALNMLQNNFDSYYVSGLRMSWSLSGFYTSKKEKAILAMNSRFVDYQKETFLLNTNLQLKQASADQAKSTNLIASDNAIISLRSRIKNTALAQLQYGVINANDYLREVNAEDQAKQNQTLHGIQLLMAQYNQKTTSGN